jgi:hypothetical protein
MDLENRESQLKREVLKRGFIRHPSVLGNLADLPPELQSPTVRNLPESEVIQTIVFFPPQIQRGWNYVPKQALLFTQTKVIHLLASIWPDQEPQITYLTNSGIIYLKATLILFYGFLEIVAQGQTSPTKLCVEFNAVFWDFLSLPIRKLLQIPETDLASTSSKQAIPQALQPEIEKLPLKFMNGLRIHGILPGETLENICFQPGSWERRMLVFRKLVTADTLLLLTSNYLVILQEELGVGQGWIVTYLRRNSISLIQNTPTKKWSEITINLQKEGQTTECNLLLTKGAAQRWREQWVQCGGKWQATNDVNQ